MSLSVRERRVEDLSSHRTEKRALSLYVHNTDSVGMIRVTRSGTPRIESVGLACRGGSPPCAHCVGP